MGVCGCVFLSLFCGRVGLIYVFINWISASLASFIISIPTSEPPTRKSCETFALFEHCSFSYPCISLQSSFLAQYFHLSHQLRAALLVLSSAIHQSLFLCQNELSYFLMLYYVIMSLITCHFHTHSQIFF